MSDKLTGLNKTANEYIRKHGMDPLPIFNYSAFISSCIEAYKKFDAWRTLTSKLWDETVFQAFSDCGYTKDWVLSPDGYSDIDVVSYNYGMEDIICFRVNNDPLFAFITHRYGNTKLVYFERKDSDMRYDCLKKLL